MKIKFYSIFLWLFVFLGLVFFLGCQTATETVTTSTSFSTSSVPSSTSSTTSTLGMGTTTSTGAAATSTTINSTTTTTIVVNLDIPFNYVFGDDNRLYFPVNSDRYLAEFTAWGAHAQGHTGHIEGDGKSNYTVHIQPSGEIIPLTGAGVEISGVTAAVALQNAPWYRCPTDGMTLYYVYKASGNDLSPYVPGENDYWNFGFYVGDEYNLAINHIGEISTSLEALLVSRLGDGVSTSPHNVDYSSLEVNPISIPINMVIGRPQVRSLYSESVGDETVHYAVAQVEWTYSERLGSYERGICGYSLMSEELQEQLQTALEEYLLGLVPYSAFWGYTTGETVPDFMAAHGDIIANPNLSVTPFDHLSSTNSRAWHDNLTSPSSEDCFVMYKVHKDNRVYEQLGDQLFENENVNFMVIRGDKSGGNNLITLTGASAESYMATEFYGQVLDLTEAQDTADNTSLIVKLTWVYPFEGDRLGALGKYWPIRYSLRSDRLIVHYGALYGTSAEALSNMPAEIPESVTADRNPYFAYDHVFY